MSDNICTVCHGTYTTKRNSKGKACSDECRRKINPIYIANTQLIEIAEFWLSLNFTPRQVFADHIADHKNLEAWVRLLERRDKYALAVRFRALDRRDGYGTTAEAPQSVDAA